MVNVMTGQLTSTPPSEISFFYFAGLIKGNQWLIRPDHKALIKYTIPIEWTREGSQVPSRCFLAHLIGDRLIPEQPL